MLTLKVNFELTLAWSLPFGALTHHHTTDGWFGRRAEAQTSFLASTFAMVARKIR